MINVDLLFATFELTLTLGDADTNNPPPLLLRFDRKGTNFSGEQILPDLGITVVPGERYVQYLNVPTSIFTDPQGFLQSGQYAYTVFDNTVPADPLEIEAGILIATETPITKKSYGTDKKRGEYKGHL